MKYEDLTPLQKRLYDGGQRMRERAFFVIKNDDGTEDLWPCLPDDELEDALREALGLPQ